MLIGQDLTADEQAALEEEFYRKQAEAMCAALKLADRIKALRLEKETINKQLADVKDEMKQAELELSDAMMEVGLHNFTRHDLRYSIETERFWSPVSGDKDPLYAAMKTQELDHMFTVNSRTMASFLNAEAKKYSDAHNGEQGVPDWLKDYVRYYEKSGLAVSTAK